MTKGCGGTLGEAGGQAVLALGAQAALPHLGVFVYSLLSAFLSLFQLLRFQG